MTNHTALYEQAKIKLAKLPAGKFRLADICDNPPANLGRVFRNDVVVKKIYPDIRRIGVDDQSVIYEKLIREDNNKQLRGFMLNQNALL
jgi:hypothetical protein